MEVATKEREGGDGNAAAASEVRGPAVVGRAVPLAMGSVRLGGAGRPVAMPAGAHANVEASEQERLRPRVVMQPHPRSPFGRKLESNVSFSLADDRETHPTTRFQVQKTAVVPPERVHAVHHPTRRTPLSAALRQSEAATSTPIQTAPSVEAEAPTTVIRHATSAAVARKRSTRDEVKMAVSRRPKPELQVRTEHGGETTKRAKHDVGSRPSEIVVHRSVDVAALVRKPPFDHDLDAHASFHRHERIFEDAIKTSTTVDSLNMEPVSSWRVVGDSIDFIYEDPSIDVVQLQLMLHGNRLGGMKRKAVERERLQLAAAEVHKQRQNLTSKMEELQRRKENISKLSEDIRSRNKPASQKVTAAKGKKKTKVETDPPQLNRKPPVPRLSQLGLKPSAAKKAKKSIDSKHGKKDAVLGEIPAGKGEDHEVSDAEEDTESDRHNLSASGSILLGTNGDAQGHVSQSEAPKRRKIKKPRSGKEVSKPQSKMESEPPHEQLQRRAVAREYMQLQKQARQLLKSKVEEEKRLEEERRRFELQRLEQVRLRELEEARKRRIKQKQRDRIQQRKIEQRQLHQPGDTQDPALTSPSKSDEGNGRKDPDAENQSIRDNAPGRNMQISGELEWPGDESASSSASSPRLMTDTNEIDEDAGAQTDTKLQKLLQLEEKAKMLTSRLQSLSNRNKRADPASIGTPRHDVTSDTVLGDEEKQSLVDSESGDSGGDDSDDDNISDHGSVTRIVDEYDEGDEDQSDGEIEIDNGGRPFASRRIDHERFAFFDCDYGHHIIDEQDEFDLASIGVQKIRVVWPRADEEEDGCDVEPQPSSRFEELSSSSSSSSRGSSKNATMHRRKSDKARSWQSDHSGGDDICTPKLLEDTVGSYAQRLLDQTARIQETKPDPDLYFERSPLTSDSCNPVSLETSQWLRDEHSLSIKARSKSSLKPSSDAELLRLIRESDDNLSVIDREAKRRFRIQQDQARQRHEERERLQAEMVKQRLAASAVDETANIHGIREDATEFEVEDRMHERRGDGSLRIVKLEDVLQAVHEDRVTLESYVCTPSPEETRAFSESDENRSDETRGFSERDENRSMVSPPAVEFWNRQLRAIDATDVPPSAPGASRHRPAPVEIDRTHLHVQSQRRFEVEDELDADEDERRRIVSPQTLAKRLLAAVEYHEAISDAHLQLSMMEKAHALDQVQQDTIALAQAFKEEMDSTLLAQHLVDEHAALESKFDEDLLKVVSQLDIVHQAEREDHDRELERAKIEAHVARQRETSVQTELPRLADATTSARLRVETGVATDHERVDFGVQHSEIRAPEEAKNRVGDEFLADSLLASSRVSQTRINEDVDEYTEDYAEETFDRASISSPGKVNRMVGEVSIEGAVESVNQSASANEIESGGSVEFDDESERDVDMESGGDDGNSVVASESSGSGDDEQIQSSVHDESEIESVSASHSRGFEMSSSVRYNDNDFEDETSMVQPAAMESTPRFNEKNGSEEESEVGEETDEGDKESIVSSDHEDVRSDNSSSRSYRSDQEKPIASTKSISAAIRPTSSGAPVTPAVTVSSFVNPSQFSPSSVSTDVGQAYVAQLENRKISEEALLSIRLQALQNKLQQEMQPLIEAINIEEQKPEKQRKTEDLRLLIGRREALQIAFLSEQANLESLRSACVSRYYQDLLAFQSLGMASALPGVVIPTNSSALFINQRGGISDLGNDLLQAPAVASVTRTEVSEKAESSVEAYSEDEFASTVGDVRLVEKGDVDDSGEVSEITDNPSVESAAEDGEEEEEIQSVVDENSGDVDEEPASDAQDPSVASDAEDDNYGDDDFASISEKTVEKVEASASEKSSVSTPSIVDESSSHVESELVTGDKRDDDGEVEDDYDDGEDEFASLSGSVAEKNRKDSVSEGDVEDDTSVASEFVEAEVCEETGDMDEDARAADESQVATSEAAYSADNIETSAIEAQDESAAVLASQSDDSSTTKLIVAEVAELNSKLKVQEERDMAKHESKLEKKKLKAQELIQVKEKLIKQQVDQYRQQEERAQVDTIAEMALGLDVNAEVEKRKTTVKEQLTSEFEVLKQAYPQLRPQDPLKPADAVDVVLPAPQSSDLRGKATAATEDENGGQYSEDYDEFEVDSFEKDGSVSSETNASEPAVSSTIKVEEADEDEHEVSETANDDVTSDIEEEGEDRSIADESGEMVEASGDETDAYGDEEFDETAASSNAADEGVMVLSDNIVETVKEESKPGSFVNQDTSTEEAAEDGEDDQYEDDDFEQSLSRQSSVASGVGEQSEKPEVCDLQESKEQQAPHVTSGEEDNSQGSDNMLERMNAELQTTMMSIAANEVDERGNTMQALASVVSKPTLLSESLSISHAEEDLVTASMDEQTKRIEDLKRRIEARKQQFAAVQRQLKIEKRKESLRDAETELWNEMEKMEAQLVADERILALTRQRGRLESIQLEAKHSGLFKQNDSAADLLDGYDFIEEVEAVRSPVIKQDHQAQVRLEFTQGTGPDAYRVESSSIVHHDAETEVDFLLAYDYVEVAERPMTTTSTATDAPDESTTKLVLNAPVLDFDARVNATRSEEDELSKRISYQQFNDANHEFHDIPSADGISVDLLSQFDYVEAVEAVDAVTSMEDGEADLLEGFDYIELVEGVGSDEASDHIKETVLVDSRVDSIKDSSDGSGREESDEKQRNESIDDSVSDGAQDSDHLEDQSDNALPVTNAHEEVNDQELVVQAQLSVELELAKPSEVDNSPHTLKNLTSASQVNSEHGRSVEQHDTELTTRVTDMVLARLLQEAIADIYVAAGRAAEQVKASEGTYLPTASDGFDDKREDHDLEEGQLLKRAIQQFDDHENVAEGHTKENDFLSEQVHADECISENVVDRLFSQLKTTAVQDGVRLHLKTKTKLAGIEQPNMMPKQPVTEVPSTLITDREVGISFANQLHLSSDLVTLPRLHECTGSHLEARNVAAIYDAVLETANIVHQQLTQDLSFQEERNMDTKKCMIIDRVQREMEESVWKRRDAAMETMDRFARKAQEDEQGELDENDLRLLQAHQRVGSEALVAHFQASAFHHPGLASTQPTSTTPRQRKRLGSAVSKSGLASHLLQQEADRLADNITERLISELAMEELTQRMSHRR